jgi:hypothetical protein
MGGTWNKYLIRNLDKSKLTRMIEYDAKDESPKVRAITRQALESIPSLTKLEIETAEALEENIEL